MTRRGVVVLMSALNTVWIFYWKNFNIRHTELMSTRNLSRSDYPILFKPIIIGSKDSNEGPGLNYLHVVKGILCDISLSSENP